MLALRPLPNPAQKTTPNLLPTSIKHNGPISTASRYWSPKSEDDGTHTAYFRGRKLRGRTVKLPEGYEGVVLQKTEQALSTPAHQATGGPGGALAEQLRRMEEGDDLDEDEEMEGVEDGREVEAKVMETKATFNEIVVWGHEMVPEDEDVYVKGVEEWIGFAAAAHSFDDTPTK